MIKFDRLGVVLNPPTKSCNTIAKYNAGMIPDGDTVHMLFRYSEGRKEYDPATMSCYSKDEIRYARLDTALKLQYEAPVALIAPSFDDDASGCQDPRIIPLDGWYYITYCGWDKDIRPAGMDRPGLGFARTKDFKTVEKLGIVKSYTWDKDHYFFPERINGKIALVHRIAPNIQIEYFDTIEEVLDQTFWNDYTPEKCEKSIVLRPCFPWENGKVGGSTPPVKTEEGWLFTYHGVENLYEDPRKPFIYRMGIALLDLENPSKVIARIPYPVLEPEEPYELEGDVANVVFPVGGYIHDGYFYISYGGADRVTAVARILLSELMEELGRYKL